MWDRDSVVCVSTALQSSGKCFQIRMMRYGGSGTAVRHTVTVVDLQLFTISLWKCYMPSIYSTIPKKLYSTCAK